MTAQKKISQFIDALLKWEGQFNLRHRMDWLFASQTAAQKSIFAYKKQFSAHYSSRQCASLFTTTYLKSACQKKLSLDVDDGSNSYI